MRESIKDNEYVRTIFGTIAKIENTEFEITYNILGTMFYKHWCVNNYIEEQIVKHSKNIIDLIELEDFVNGYFVHAINYIEKRVSVMSMNEYGYSENIDLYEKDIKSIVTKEQFKSIEYEV
jgi:hypothetical protein